jgi:hypothetical protein
MKRVPGARVPILRYFEGNPEVARQSFYLYVNVGTYRLLSDFTARTKSSKVPLR